MDRIIIIDDHGIQNDLEAFLNANKNRIHLNSNIRELAEGSNPLVMEIIKRYEEKYKILFKTPESVYLFRINEIMHIELETSFITVYLYLKDPLKLNGNQDMMEDIDLKYPLVKVHQHHVVNMNFISRISASAGCLYLNNLKQIPVSAEMMQQLINGFNKLNM